jgi:hypothetical protein
MSVTVVSGGGLRGFSGVDHLIDDSQIAEMVGSKYRSGRHALRESDKRCFLGAYGSQPRKNHPFTWLEVRGKNGITRRISSDPMGLWGK